MSKLKANVKTFLVVCTVFALTVIPTLAADEAASGTTAIMQTGMTTAKTEILGMVSVALPIGIGLVATFLGIKKGIAFFKTLANKA